MLGGNVDRGILWAPPERDNEGRVILSDWDIFTIILGAVIILICIILYIIYLIHWKKGKK